MNDIDTLMHRIEEINAKDPPLSRSDVADLITYHRRSREMKASGIKPTPKQKADVKSILDKIVGAKAVPIQKINRRI